MSAKSSGLFQGRKGIKKGAVGTVTLKGSRGLISLRSLSIRRTSEGDGKYAFMVALGEGSDPLLFRCKTFQCDEDLGFDDENARVKAFHFAVSTDGIPVFRAFVLEDGCGLGYGSSTVNKESIMLSRDDLDARICEQGRLQSREFCERKPVSYVCLRKNVRAGLIFAVAMVRLESEQHRTISFHMQRRHNIQEDEYANGDEEQLTRAVTFLRSAAFEFWSRNGSNSAFGQGDQSGSQHRERGLKHPFSCIGIEDGEKVDCFCGKNRSKGLMVACEECGVWEHAECLGYRFDSQASAPFW